MRSRTVISAMNPIRSVDDCRVLLTVWFEEFAEPIPFIADPFDPERHGKELWIRAMRGEYGPVQLVETQQQMMNDSGILLLPSPGNQQ